MPVNINKLHKGSPSHFVNVGAMIMFDKIEDSAYAAATGASFVNPVDLGDILQDSTSWDGDEISVENIKNEQGENVVTYPVNGTYAYSFNVMSTDAETLKKLMVAEDLSGFTTGTWVKSPKVIGIGDKLASFVCPVAWVNQDQNREMLFPKARVTSTLAYDNDLLVVHVSVVAEKVSTANLKTIMMIDGALDYGSAEA